MIQQLQMVMEQLPPEQQQAFVQQLSQIPPERRVAFVEEVLSQFAQAQQGQGPPQAGPPPVAPPSVTSVGQPGQPPPGM